MGKLLRWSLTTKFSSADVSLEALVRMWYNRLTTIIALGESADFTKTSACSSSGVGYHLHNIFSILTFFLAQQRNMLFFY